MLIDKEYPATHSMDTVWFAVDEAGEVAIFQFEEEGPEPVPFTDIHSDELLLDYFAVIHDGMATMLQFTKEQIEELKSELKDPTLRNVWWNCNVILAPDGLKEIEEKGANVDLCYSQDERFYHIEYWDGNEDQIEQNILRLIADGIILKACQCDLEIYFEDRRDDKSGHRLQHFPFYVYEQDYNQMAAPKRVVVPKYPLKEEQLPETAKPYTFHLPVHFSELEQVQPAEFLDSDCWNIRNQTKQVNGITYMQVPLTHGGFGYVKMLFDEEKPNNYDSAPRVIDKSEDFVDKND